MPQKTENRQHWFAIRVTYSRELSVKNHLDTLGIESYVPMYLAERTYSGRKCKAWTPLIHNLLFIRISDEGMKALKAESTLPIRYIMDRETKSPTIIPDRQMEDFMAVVATRNENVEIVAPESIDLTKGDLVRVTDGIFAGIEGRYIRHKGHSKVAVTICEIATALTAYVPARYIERITNDFDQ